MRTCTVLRDVSKTIQTNQQYVMKSNIFQVNSHLLINRKMPIFILEKTGNKGIFRKFAINNKRLLILSQHMIINVTSDYKKVLA